MLADDLGRIFNCKVDPPVVIRNAVKDSVRRWRLARVGSVLPNLIPTQCDIGAPQCANTVLVDFTSITAPLLNGRGSGARSSDDWQPKWKGDLASAMSGGQWSQTRKMAVDSWNITDDRCQLCLDEAGILEPPVRL